MVCKYDDSTLNLFVPLNDDEIVRNASDEMAFVSVSEEPTNTSPIIVLILPPITDIGLGDINTKNRDNSAHTSQKVRNNLVYDNSTKMVQICQ